MEHTSYIDILISKVISGNANQKEIEELREWKSNSDKNISLIKKNKKIWEYSNLYLSDSEFKKDRIAIEEQYNSYISKQLLRVRKYSFIYKIVAIIAIPITFCLSIYLWKNFSSLSTSEQLCTIASPPGHISKCNLPDGSEVWINTGSSLTYDALKFNKKKRNIILKGEAYFNVSHNPKKTFTVKTSYADINVKGTSFNVLAYPGDSLFESVLTKGSVEIQLKTGQKKLLQIKPNQRIIYNKNNNNIDLDEVDTQMFTSWRNGEIFFKDATLNDLIKELERIYNICFHMTPTTLGNYRFRGMFSYNNNLIDALEKIKKTSDIDYYIKNKEVYLEKIK